MRIGLSTMGSDILFHRDERWLEKDQSMTFTAELKGRLIPCFISADVLKVHFASERYGRFQAFRENRQQIEEVAARKVEARPGQVRLDLADFNDAADFIPWER